MRPVGGVSAVDSLRSSCQAGVLGNVEEPFEGPIHHRIDAPRLESFFHYQMIQAAIVFHRVSGSIFAGAHYPYHSEPMSIPRSLWIPI